MEDWEERRERAEAERREHVRLWGIEPRDPYRGRIRVIGAYVLPYFPETSLLEVQIHQSPNRVDFSTWLPYRPPAWDADSGIGLAHFYFDREGRELIGSYLTPPRLEPVFRAGLLLAGLEEHGVLIRDRMHWIRKTTPVPERLLRLTWIEEGLGFSGPDQVLGGDL